MISALANHLWQSTLFALVAWLLTLALRKNRARVRYCLWLATSLKFLAPFSILVRVGSQFGWGSERSTHSSQVSLLIENLSQPFGEAGPLAAAATLPSHATANPSTLTLFSLVPAVWMLGCAGVLICALWRWRHLAGALRQASPIQDGREKSAFARMSGILRVKQSVPLLSSQSSLEPGVFGILRPVLCLPTGLASRLSDSELHSIIAHELCHIRRRDNLAALIHMAVEAIFWFHPLVWWIGTRMVDERERACDESVLNLGGEPQAYAEGILKVCEFYVESPLSCAAGVTGSNLKKRIEAIMSQRGVQDLHLKQRLLLFTAGILAFGAPIVFGMRQAPQSQTPETKQYRFEVASIKSTPAGTQIGGSGFRGGRFTATNIAVKTLVSRAYGVLNFQVSGGPSWLDSDRYDIEAKAEGEFPTGPFPNPQDNPLNPMIRQLLEERFKLQTHRETRDMPTYALVVAKGGLKGAALNSDDASRPGTIRLGRGELIASRVPISFLINYLSGQVSRVIVDKTNLPGQYDLRLQWTPDQPLGLGGPDGGRGAVAPPVDPGAPNLLTAMEDQLGLKLESSRGPVEIIVIDRVEKPTEN